jgi:V/A-type H+/Na+-transporting ATPase subunit F
MSRLIVLTDGETAPGYGLAGVEVVRADEAAEARARLAELMADPTVGLVAVDEGLLARLDAAERRRLEALTTPVVVGLPPGTAARGGPDRRAALAALLRRAIGFDLSFPGEGLPPA